LPNLVLRIRRVTKKPTWAGRCEVWQETLLCSNYSQKRICTCSCNSIAQNFFCLWSEFSS